MILDFTIYRPQRRFPGDRGFTDHALVQAKRPDEKLSATRDQLVNALEGANTKHGRCWAIISIGIQLSFYEYHAHLPEKKRLVDWCPPGQSTNSFHLRQDVRIIQWMFDYMKANTEPPVLV
ncbi:hypothetical protein N7456_002671 [Penicillium angulare]|uniref:Uncharacterized protein n=1 Tax=Penicillium angulare TaxID=116970 RepID=A0A9W9KQE8_9EURO|nr:hypothetical protein N7456_002671 [Penicillium angulare]